METDRGMHRYTVQDVKLWRERALPIGPPKPRPVRDRIFAINQLLGIARSHYLHEESELRTAVWDALKAALVELEVIKNERVIKDAEIWLEAHSRDGSTDIIDTIGQRTGWRP